MTVGSAAFAQTPAPAAQPVDAPAPVAQPAPAPAPVPVAVPPGYMLVPVAEPATQTRYDVQYPQTKGALPPGMELPYEEGDPIPPGYRLRSQPRKGLIVAGSIVTGVPWVFSVMAAVGNDFDDKTGFLLIPAVGPWLTLLAGGGKDRDCGSSSDFCNADRAGTRALLVLDGMMQTAGAVMFVAGIALPRKRLVRQDVTVGFVPTPLGKDGYGIGAVGTF